MLNRGGAKGLDTAGYILQLHQTYNIPRRRSSNSRGSSVLLCCHNTPSVTLLGPYHFQKWSCIKKLEALVEKLGSLGEKLKDLE